MILLDTHALFWLNESPEKLSRDATRAIRRAASGAGLGLASISLWELAVLIHGGRLRVKGVPTKAFLDALLQTPGLTLLDITSDIALLATQFPPEFTRDPADRLIAATARAYDAPLVTKDRELQDSPLLRTIW